MASSGGCGCGVGVGCQLTTTAVTMRSAAPTVGANSRDLCQCQKLAKESWTVMNRYIAIGLGTRFIPLPVPLQKITEKKSEIIFKYTKQWKSKVIASLYSWNNWNEIIVKHRKDELLQRFSAKSMTSSVKWRLFPHDTTPPQKRLTCSKSVPSTQSWVYVQNLNRFRALSDTEFMV